MYVCMYVCTYDCIIIIIGVQGRCSVHLINDGITQFIRNGETVASIDWGLSAPKDVLRSAVDFTCSLDGARFQPCKKNFICIMCYTTYMYAGTSPYEVIVSSPGDHELVVRPTRTGGCARRASRKFLF